MGQRGLDTAVHIGLGRARWAAEGTEATGSGGRKPQDIVSYLKPPKAGSPRLSPSARHQAGHVLWIVPLCWAPRALSF